MNPNPWKRDLPNLSTTPYQETSPEDPNYNCIAWAADPSTKTDWWWPDPLGVAFWPDGVDRVPTVEAFTEAFKTQGYSPCADGEFEDGLEKVAIFADAALVTHAARQVDDEWWTSKLGPDKDISHKLNGIEGGSYGHAMKFVSRKKPGS